MSIEATNEDEELDDVFGVTGDEGDGKIRLRKIE